MSTDLVKEARGKRKKNLQRWTENSNQNLLFIPQSYFKLISRFLGTRAKEPLEILPKKRRFMVVEPFLGRHLAKTTSKSRRFIKKSRDWIAFVPETKLQESLGISVDKGK